MHRVDVVLVHFHTPELLARSVESFERELRDLGVGEKARIVVVDNGSEPSDRPLLAGDRVELVEPGANLGFAGGVNLGVERGSGDVVVVANPDLVLCGCLAPLIAEIDGGADIVGPRFFWDAGLRWQLPPSERADRVTVLLGALAERGPGWAERARRRWRRHARRHWSANAPLDSHALSGALLAFRREAWRRLGPFDPGYRLYFEETDWLERARERRLEARYVPAARAIHSYARSAVHQPLAAEWFEASARRFRRRHYGAPFRWLLARAAARDPEAAWRWLEPLPESIDLQAFGVAEELGIEVSSRAVGFPATECRVQEGEAEWSLSEQLAERLGTPYRVTLVDVEGRELAAWARR